MFPNVEKEANIWKPKVLNVRVWSELHPMVTWQQPGMPLPIITWPTIKGAAHPLLALLLLSLSASWPSWPFLPCSLSPHGHSWPLHSLPLSAFLCFHYLPKLPSHALNKLYSILCRCVAGPLGKGCLGMGPLRHPYPHTTVYHILLASFSFYDHHT